ncbi:MAG: TonB-dependent receptor family protein [Muribaculaceae bacterium]|nr:TonB-dependent receptor family protein [Muribaculaceae bacterium]
MNVRILITQLSQSLKFSRKGRKGTEFQYIGKLRIAVIASTLRLRAVSHRPALAENKRSSCAKGLLINTREQEKLKLIIIALLLPFTVFGKVVSGRVVDTSDIPIVFANVVLMTDSTIITGSTTNESGLFSIEDNQTATTVKISKAGYEDIEISINETANLGNIVMKKADIILDEVIVNGNIPKTQLKGNAIVTNVQNSVLSKMGNAYEVLTHTPMVTGINGELNVFGRGVPTVYINSHLVRDITELQQLKSDEILSIELISNPGASYSSDINSVIKIKTLPPKGEGLGVDVNETLSIWEYARNTFELNMRYRHNRLELFGNIDLYDGKRKYEDVNEMTTFGRDTFVQSLCNSSVLNTDNLFGKIGFSYTLPSNHSFGGYYRLGRAKYSNDGHLETQSRRLEDVTSSVYERFSSLYRSTSSYFPSQEANMYYNGSIDNLNIDFNADIMQNRNIDDDIHSDYPFGDNASEQKVLSNGLTKNRLLAEKLIVSFPVWKGDFEIGEEYTGSKLSYRYKYEGAPIENSYTQIDEKNIATFANISQSFGKWNVSLGLRYEYADFKYTDDFSSDGQISRRYSNLFPSLAVNAKIGNVRLSFDFTNKMKRPSYRKLDGKVKYVNRFVYQAGNPLLKPTRIYNLQAMGMWRYFYAVMMYVHELDAVFNTTRNYADGSSVKVMTFMNVPHYQYFQFTLGAQLSFSCWQPTPEIGMFKQFSSILYNGVMTSFNKPMYSFTLDNVFTLPGDWQIGADIWLYSSANSQNCYIEPTQQLSLSVRKSFFNESLVLQLKAVDLLDKASNKVTIYSGDIQNYMYNHHEPRNVNLTVRYYFNKSKSRYKGTGAGKNEKRRM